MIRLARPFKLRLLWPFCSSGAAPVGAEAQQMSLVSRTHQHGPQTQLAISASGGNCTRMHLGASPVHFFREHNFLLEFLGSEATYVTLVVSRAQWRHFRGAYGTCKHTKKAKHKTKEISNFVCAACFCASSTRPPEPN